MSDAPQFEIPESVRELAERNVAQARSAYQQFMDMARQAQEMVAKSQGAMAAGALEIQLRAMKYAEENVDAGFRFATDLSRARDLQEVFEVQQRHMQRHMQNFASQAQELGRMMAATAEKAKPKT
jgi:hypothetical protein